jgi:osmotically-inducible protein OsmY
MTSTRSITAAGMFMLLGAMAGCATRTASSDSGYKADDQTTAAVDAAISAHPDIGPAGQVRISTINHVVYLTGMVNSGYQRSVAESVAAQTEGVTQVVNSIGVSR